MTKVKTVYSCDKCGTETDDIWNMGFYGDKKATCQLCSPCKDEIVASLSKQLEWKPNPKTQNY